MEMKKILKGVSVLLIAVAMVISTVAVTANTVEEKDEEINIAYLKSDNPNPSYNNDKLPLIGSILFSQQPFTPDENWWFYLSEASIGYRVHDEYWDVNTPICDIHWWGLSLFWTGTEYVSCDPDGMCFEIIFWDGLLGNPVCVYTQVCPTAVPTGQYYNGMEMYYWETILDPCCDLIPNGWVSIQSIFSPNECWFLWAGSDDGDLYAYQEGATEPDLGTDAAFELTGGCQPSIDVEKYVKGKCGDWVDADTEDEALDLPICTDATFKIVITNDGECCGDLFDIFVFDLMHDSLKYISADPEPEYFYYYPPYYVIYWSFPYLEQGETIEIYVTAHVEGPECSRDENYVEVYGYSDCAPYEVFDWDSAWVHAYENKPPSAPKIDGPTKGKDNTELCWKFHSTDPNGDPVRYVIDWGDNSTNTTICYPSCTPVEVCHTYTARGTYTITAVAIDCCWGAESENGTLDVEIPRNRAVSHPLIQWFSLRFPNLFPILRYIFGI